MRTSGNLVEGNYIGTKAGGGGALANRGDGVFIRGGATNNTVGGTAAGAGNTIANSGSDGVQVAGAATTGDAILSNSIFASHHPKLGIALTSGGNANEPAPIVASVTTAGASTRISGTVPAASPRVEVFVNPSCADPEGKKFLGSAMISGHSWSLQVAKLAPGQGVTATATSSSNTSQFSSCKSS